MIFIKNKKAWKEFVRENDMKPYAKPTEFPCYQYYSIEYSDTGLITASCNYIYQYDAQSMLEKLENGREF